MRRTKAGNEIEQLAAEAARLQEKARALGMFDDDRELLECPRCGLLEDVTIGGLLVTYHPTPDDAAGHDSGLRFVELSAGRFRCPECGATVSEPTGA
jgi:predicted RNA-binding Zn-ribbon protein involved in translation (DUF1610 family)